MTGTAYPDRDARFLRVLGDELRRARKRRGWRRQDLLARLRSDISLQAVATYELGTRACSVVRLLELTDVLETSMPELLGRVLDRITDRQMAAVVVDLVAVARCERPNLQPLRRWAQARLDHAEIHEPMLVPLDPSGVAWLAKLCDMDAPELTTVVRALFNQASSPPAAAD